MRTVRLTMAQALVKWLVAQRTVVDGHEVPLFPGVFAIFGFNEVRDQSIFTQHGAYTEAVEVVIICNQYFERIHSLCLFLSSRASGGVMIFFS